MGQAETVLGLCKVFLVSVQGDSVAYSYQGNGARPQLAPKLGGIMALVKTADKKQVGVLATLKANLAADLEAKGLPSKVYIVVLSKAPSPAWLKENGVTCHGEGLPIIGAKGGIMYNTSGRGDIHGEKSRIGGNVFLSDMSADEETRLAYMTAKQEEKDAFEVRKLVKGGMTAEEAAKAVQDAKDEEGETA